GFPAFRLLGGLGQMLVQFFHNAGGNIRRGKIAHYPMLAERRTFFATAFTRARRRPRAAAVPGSPPLPCIVPPLQETRSIGQYWRSGRIAPQRNCPQRARYRAGYNNNHGSENNEKNNP